MTLGETQWSYGQSCNDCMGNPSAMEAGFALKEVLVRAKLEQRITCGVYQAAKKLDIEPERVMMCIHADLCVDDVALQLHFALMEAFCWENQIRLLKVGDVESIQKLLGEVVSSDIPDTTITPGVQSPRLHPERDFSCLLVEIPEKKDEACHALINHYEHLSEVTPFPHITLAT